MKKLFLAAIIGTMIVAGCKEEEEISRIEIVEGKEINIEAGEEMRLHIKCYPEHLKAPSETNCKWKSSNSDVVDVSFGKIKAESVGDAEITVTTKDNLSASCHIVVNQIRISDIQLGKTYYEMLVGESVQLDPDISPIQVTWYEYKLLYNTNNRDVAVVGDDGKIEAVGPGECQVTVSSPDRMINAHCKIRVLPNEVTNITLNNSELIIDKGESFNFDATFEPANVSDKTIKWLTSNDKVATIDETGKLVGIDYGDCIITAISSNEAVKAECKVKVSSVRGLELSKMGAKILTGSTDVLTATVLPATAANKNVIWTSSDEAIATVENGTVTGVAAGTATITAKTEDGGFEQKCGVTVGGIDIFMSAQNGNVVTTFTNFGVYTYVSCEISNDSNVDVFVKSANVSGTTFDISETLSSGSKISKTFHNSGSIIVWTIVYDGVEYDVVSEFNSMYGLGNLLGY